MRTPRLAIDLSPRIELPLPSTEILGTTIGCQLLDSINEAETLNLLNNPGWCTQEELDGTRMLLGYWDNTVHAFDRQGRPVTAPSGFMLAALGLGSEFLLDGEAVGETYHAFDLLKLSRCDLRPMPFGQRLDVLNDFLHRKDHWAIKQVPTARLRWEKEAMFETLRGERQKGIVLKHLEGPYLPGRTGSVNRPRKCAFVRSASFLVTGHTDKRAVMLGLLENSRQVQVGRITIPAGHEIPPLGAVVEASYLLPQTGSSQLRHLSHIRRRHDVRMEECVADQLKEAIATR